MALLAWVVTPMIAPRFTVNPGFVFWILMLLGLAWQCVVALYLVRKEEGDLRWETLKNRLRLGKPQDPKTGKARSILFLWIIPFIMIRFLLLELPLPDLESMLFPFLKNLPEYAMQDLATPEYKGAWWLFGLMLLHLPLNYIIGEEFLFRGILLPKMQGVFGRWDWFANGVLFAFYHLHRPNGIFWSALWIGFVFSYPAKRFRCTWMSVMIHGVEGLFFLFIVSGIVLGVV